MAGQQALHNFLNQGVPAPTAPGKASNTQVLPPAPKQKTPTPQQKKVAARDLEAQKQANIDRREEDERSRARINAGAKVGGAALAGVQERVGAVGDAVTGWADRMPTPGGIGLLLAAIFILLWAVVPVNGGHTRLTLLWMTLMGRTRMALTPDAGGTYDASTPAGGAGGGFQASTPTADLLSQLGVHDWSSGV